MWHLFQLYINKTKEIWLMTLFIYSVIFYGLSVFMFFLPGLFQLVISVFALNMVEHLLTSMGFEAFYKNQVLALMFLVLIVTCFYIPTNWVTLANCLWVGAVISAVIAAHSFDLIVKEKFGAVFSLTKLLLNPSERLQKLGPILEENPPSDYAEHLNLVNDVSSVDDSAYCRPFELDLTNLELNSLIARQCNAINNLPNELKELRQRIESDDYSNKDINEILSIKTKKYESYRANLIDSNQALFDTYLSATLNMTHARCSITLEVLSPQNKHEFFILEKRYRQNNKICAVPGSSTLFYLDPEQKDIFSYLLSYNEAVKRFTFKHPLFRDCLFYPRKHGDFLVEYRRYSYKIVEAHPLSLQVCESIEAFNYGMQLKHNVTRHFENHKTPPKTNSILSAAAGLLTGINSFFSTGDNENTTNFPTQELPLNRSSI